MLPTRGSGTHSVDINPVHVRTLQAIARSGGFSRAGEILHLSQPAISHHVRHLEARAGRAAPGETRTAARRPPRPAPCSSSTPGAPSRCWTKRARRSSGCRVAWPGAVTVGTGRHRQHLSLAGAAPAAPRTTSGSGAGRRDGQCGRDRVRRIARRARRRRRDVTHCGRPRLARLAVLRRPARGDRRRPTGAGDDERR